MYKPRMRIQPIRMPSQQLQAGNGIFSSIGNFFRRAGNTLVDNLKRPSTYLGAAGMLPTPLAPVFKGASFITRLAGQGRKKRRGAKKKVAKKKTKAVKRKRKAKK